jgi:pilus assembly protein CpaE
MYPLATSLHRYRGGCVPASTVLLLSSHDASAEEISATLTGVGYTVTTIAATDEAFQRAAEHQIVILDVDEDNDTTIEVCREIRATPALASIPVLCVSRSDEVEERIRFLEAGADDVMAKPFDRRELEARVEALLLRFQRSRDLAPVRDGEVTLPVRARRTVAVFSPKGGVGTTTIATNIAMALAMERPDTVVVADLDLQFGAVATHLNVEARQTVADLARDEAALREAEILRTYATRHDAGLHVIAAPPNPEAAEQVTGVQVEQLIATALGTYDVVVVDAGSHLDERTLAALGSVDSVVLPFSPEMAALRAVHSFVDYLNESGSVVEKTTFVLNNSFAKQILKRRDIETALGTTVSAELPYDPFLYLKAVNEGVPVVAGAPRSTAAGQLTKLASMAMGRNGMAMPEVAESGRKGRRLGGLLRRS